MNTRVKLFVGGGVGLHSACRQAEEACNAYIGDPAIEVVAIETNITEVPPTVAEPYASCVITVTFRLHTVTAWEDGDHGVPAIAEAF